MIFTNRNTSIKTAVKKRNYASIVSLGLLLSNIVLSLMLFNHEERWVLVPQFEVEQKYTIHGNQYDQHYLEHWAGALVRDFLTVNPASVDEAMQRFLRITSIHYGQVKPNIEAQAKEIKEHHLTTAFYPKEYKVDSDKKVVEVTGSFLTWFGREKLPIEQTKTFLVGWRSGPKGILLVHQFEERKAS
jgi:type IV conjugative transfer system protein TraE